MNDQQNKNSSIISILGYFWFSITCIWTLFQIVERFFHSQLSGVYIPISVFSSSCISTILLHKYYPSFLSFFLYKKSDSEKYFAATFDDNLLFYKRMTLQNLNHIENEWQLLETIRLSIINEKYEEAIKVGVFNSRIFLQLGKHSIRVINGLYIFHALSKWGKNTAEREDNSASYRYIKYLLLINDLGWSLHSITKDQYTEVCKIIENSEILRDGGILNRDENYQRLAKRNITSAKEELIKKDEFHKLICQAIRHIISIDDSSMDNEAHMRDLERFISKIENKKDRLEMEANISFAKATKALKEEHSEPRLLGALKKLEDAENIYSKINDANRAIKCYWYRGKIYEYLSQINNGDEENFNFVSVYKNGADKSEEIGRYDEMLKNILSFIDVTNNDDERECYARKGLRVAKLLKDTASYIECSKIAKPKHIVLVRPGESEKNLQKIINGNGVLTSIGKKQMSTTAKRILNCLVRYGFEPEETKIYWCKKRQIIQSGKIFKRIIPEAKFKYSNLLKPTHLGTLANISEFICAGRNDFIKLERWRNRELAISELDIEDMEPPSEFWSRAEKFFEEIKENEFSIILCTTSISILLTHYLLGNHYTSTNYRHIDVPVGGIIHFVEDTVSYELQNIDTLTNIAYFEIDNKYLMS